MFMRFCRSILSLRYVITSTNIYYCMEAKEIRVVDYTKQTYGDYPFIQSAFQSGRKWTPLNQVDQALIGQEVLVRARLNNSTGKGNSCFIFLRENYFTLQTCAFKSENISKEMIKYMIGVPNQSIVDIFGTVVKPDKPISSCSQQVELSILKFFVVNRAIGRLPLQIADASRRVEHNEFDPNEGEEAVKVEEKIQEKKEEVKVEQKKEEVKVQEKKEEVKVQKKKEGAKAQKKKEEGKVQKKKEEVKVEKKKEEVKVEKKKEEVKVQEKKEEVKQGEIKETVKVQEKKEEGKTEEATTEVKTEEKGAEDKQKKPKKDKKQKKKREEKPKEVIQQPKEGPIVLMKTRLDNRVIDLRTTAKQAIFKLSSGVCHLFREFCHNNDFVEIHTPKLIGGSSEGGSNVFTFSYFNRKACLAQSPQLYKQMCVMGDFQRVYEIGPVFRAQNSFTHRHMCEFVGLDIQMTIKEHYFELLDFFGELFPYIFSNIEKKYGVQLKAINEQFQFAPFKCPLPALRLTFAEGIQLLKENGVEWPADEDLNTEVEKKLGQFVKAKYDTDFYMLHRYPISARPFYTMLCEDDPTVTCSYDFFMRGQEILSGAQRIHDPQILTQRAIAKGIDPSTIADYIESFKYGAYPHGGGGIGLERVVMLYCGLKNIRNSSLFPRDPKRITP